MLQYLYVFLVGGALCAIAQLLIDKTKITSARILVIYVCSGVFLTAFKLYEPLVEFAGAGATVPLTGFGYTLAKGVEKAAEKDGLLGVLTGGFVNAAAGIVASFVFAVIFSLIFKSKDKD